MSPRCAPVRAQWCRATNRWCVVGAVDRALYEVLNLDVCDVLRLAFQRHQGGRSLPVALAPSTRGRMAEGRVDSGDREDFLPGLFGSRAVVPGPGWLAVAFAGTLDEPTLDGPAPDEREQTGRGLQGSALGGHHPPAVDRRLSPRVERAVDPLGPKAGAHWAHRYRGSASRLTHSGSRQHDPRRNTLTCWPFRLAHRLLRQTVALTLRRTPGGQPCAHCSFASAS